MGKWLVFLVFVVPCFRALAQPASIHYKRADSLFAAGRYAECLEERLKAQAIAEKSGNCKQVALGYLQIGRSYYYLQDKAKAGTWIRNSLAAAQKCAFDSLIGIDCRNLGALFIETGKTDSAMLYLKMAQTLLTRLHLYPELASLYAMLFEVQVRGKQDFTAAKRSLDSCRIYSIRVNDTNQLAFYFMKEGIYWHELKEYSKAMDAFRKAAELYQQVSSIEGKMYALSSLSLSQKEAGKHLEALESMNMYVALRDTVFKAQTAQNLARYQTQFETQKKEIENLALKNRNERQQMGFGAGILILVLGGFGWIKWRELAHRQQMEKQKREEQRHRFADVLKAQEEERTRIARDLHDGLGHLMAAIKLNSSALELADEQSIRIHNQTQNIIDQASTEVRQISHRLMPQSLSDLGLAESLRELAHRINASGKIAVQIDTPDSLKLDKAIEVALYRVVQEVLNNTLKHANATSFSIRLWLDNQHIYLAMEDNGKGFWPDTVSSNSGIGWKNIQSRVDMVNGTMTLDSEPGKGMRVEIRIPLNSIDLPPV